ncbi:uncharacterized protein YfbL-like [Saccoglossus kowalevskii]|uniref:Uncharacterized protein LOC100378460 n=1 Tax=Saccoglossus kowalevskii TaxID=10224 RepID=A0ABM0GMK0_SACKO|nr:PREDICTED: uncharacterized protein LOC100378460 [Saccoglossus kowalevskii]
MSSIFFLIHAVLWENKVFCGTSRELEEISSRLRTQLIEHFSVNRHEDFNPTNKDNVRNYIKETMESYNLEVELQYFDSLYTQYEGTNIIGVLPGPLVGTADDRVVLLGAHYDSEKLTPGVDDNGSGMAILLEAAAMVTSSICEHRNTVIFAAFDLEEWQDVAGDISIGSLYFVQKWLLPFLTNDNGAANSSFQGALIMETAMNYNNTVNSQMIPYGFEQVFPDVYAHLVNRGFRGDFLNVIGRRTDAVFSDKFVEHLARIDDTKPVFYTEATQLPIDGVPTDGEINMFGDYFRSDHTRFWEVGPPYLKALFITDSANFRSPMDACYHQECDNLAMITADNLLFLARTTKAATTMIEELAMDCPVGTSSLLKSSSVVWCAVLFFWMFIAFQ